MSQIDIIQFNVLSSAMAKYIKSELSNQERLIVLKGQFTEFLKSKDYQPVFCLQECGHTEMEILHPLFSSHLYYCVCAHYSTLPGRDGFGNVIAFPTERFEMLAYHASKPSDKIKEPEGVSPDDYGKPIDRVVQDNLFEECEKRDNVLQEISLRDKKTGKVFNVYNWHMPCKWYWPAILTVFSEALLKSIDRALPFIVCSDLNTIPDRPQYAYLTGKKVDFDKDNLPYATWQSVSELPVLHDTVSVPDDASDVIGQSPYSSKNFTTYCDGAEKFKGVLDYVFTSEHFKCLSDGPDKFPEEFQPSKTNGSDHFALKRTLTFKD